MCIPLVSDFRPVSSGGRTPENHHKHLLWSAVYEKGMVGRLQKWLAGVIGVPPSRTSSPGGGLLVNLYECSNCEDTYVSTGMRSCPSCGRAVDSIDSERDLGLI